LIFLRRVVSSLIVALALVSAMAGTLEVEVFMQTRIIRISVAAKVASSAHHASLLVALHVTKRHNGANANNRVSVRAGIRGTNDSNEALSKAVSVRSCSCWLGGNDASTKPANVKEFF